MYDKVIQDDNKNARQSFICDAVYRFTEKMTKNSKLILFYFSLEKCVQ